MGERGIEVKVGILVTICVALLVVFVILLGDFRLTSGSELFLDVETSAALKTGASVKVAGVDAGKVARVEYRGGEVDEATGRPVFVRVTLRIDDDKLATLRRDARFYITTQGVLGEKYVEIEPLGITAPPLAAGDVVEAEPPLRLEVMAMNASRVLAALSDLLRKNEHHLDSIIEDAAGSMTVVRRALDRVDALLAADAPKVSQILDELLAIEGEVMTLARSANAALGDGTEVRGAIRNAAAVLADVRRSVGPVVGDVRKALRRYTDLADVGGALVAEAREVALASLARVDAILVDVKTITARVESGEGTIGALISDQEMYDDVREMMKDLRRHPWKFIWKE